MNATQEGQDASEDQTTTLAVSGAIIVLAIITVILRFYVRIVTRAGISWDDYMILLAGIVTLVTAALLVWGNSVDPNGAEASTNTDPNFVFSPDDVLYTKLSYLSSVFYFTIAGSTKLGILLMYYRIFSASRSFRRELTVAIFLAVSWWIGCTVATLTDCIPLYYNWINALDDPRYCFNFNIFWMASGVCELLVDIVILVLPIRMVYQLHMSLGRKISVAGIFLLGAFVIVTGLVKIILGYVPGERNPSFARTEVWTVVHAGTAIICASLPIFRPLGVKIGRLLGVSKLSTYGSQSQGRNPWSWSTLRMDRSSQRTSGLANEEGDHSRIELHTTHHKPPEWVAPDR